MTFELIKKEKSDFLGGTLYFYRHKRTGCEVFHIHNDDQENAFLFAVPSYSNDDSGVAHILEHSVLSGSERYRVKSPFFRLEQGSCRTYLNASTYPDRTLYPGASLLKEDLFNIMSMSGDAIWYPLLKEDVFRQEGFHFLFENEDEPRSAGVVYNEMKGVFSDKFTLLENEIQRRIFLDTAYRFDSGGNPEAIPYISYQQFLDFHQTYYRPEHTKIILYGNIPSEEYLGFIENDLLSRWKDERRESLELQEIQEHKDLCVFDNGEEQIHLIDIPSSQQAAGEEGSVDITWLVGDTRNFVETSLLRFVHFVLLGIPGAPLRKVIMESDFVEDISPLSGPSAYLLQSTYTVGAVGISESDYGKFRELVFETLEDIVKKGVSEKLIEAALSRIEFSFKERLNNTSGKINWISSLASKWLYKEDPFLYADVPALLENMKNALRKPRVLEDFIQKHFLDNRHRTIVGAHADSNYEQEYREQEKKILSALYQDEREKSVWKNIQQRVQSLHQIQDSPEEIAKVPQLQKSSLPKKISKIEHKELRLSKTDTLVNWIEHVDNGVVYMIAYFDITNLILQEEYKFLLPTFAAALTDIGVKKISYDDMSIELCLSTGRLGATINNVIHCDGSSRALLKISISVLEEKLSAGFDLLEQIMMEPDFDNTSRLKEILAEGKMMMRNRIMDSGTTIAIMKAARNYSFNALLDDDWNGIAQLEWLLDIDIDRVTKQLKELQKLIFDKGKISCTVVANTKYRDRVMQHLETSIDKLDSGAETTAYKTDIETQIVEHDPFGIKLKIDYQVEIKKAQAIILPTKVAYNCLLIPAVGYRSKDFAFYNLASRIISERLLEEIRMEYGAYGASATVLGDEELMVCYTYRDPNIIESFDVFERVIRSIANGEFDDTALDSHIVGAVGESLVQYSPIAKAKLLSSRMHSGISDDIRQSIREQYLSASREDIIKVADTLLENLSRSSRASVCNEDMLHRTKEAIMWDNVEYPPH